MSARGTLRRTRAGARHARVRSHERTEPLAAAEVATTPPEPWTNTVPSAAVARQEAQVLLASGLSSLREAHYWLVHVEDRDDAKAEARAWLGRLLERNLVHTPARLDLGATRQAAGDEGARLGESVTVAFSHAGLVRLGIAPADGTAFPRAFSQGMGSEGRGRLLGDWDGKPAETSGFDRREWAWSDADAADHEGADVVHMLVMHFSRDDATTTGFEPPYAPAGVRATRIRGCPSYLQPDTNHPGRILGYEAFGFRDGVGQPQVPELRAPRAEAASKPAADHGEVPVALGEFVLGQINGYGEPSPCPDVPRWPSSTEAPRFGHHASYLAVRQIEQFVDNFLAYHGPAQAPSDAEKMMGLRRDADATRLCTGRPGDDFAYRLVDPLGNRCPRGAHARRANPRDSIGADVASGVRANNLHRLLRRGRTYTTEPRCNGSNTCGADEHRTGRAGPSGRAGGCGTGLMFVACNADLERQFEFVQQRWMMNPRFGDLSNEDDPLLGRKRRFTLQGSPWRPPLEPLPEFTRTIGGGYFLLPGLTALRFIAGLPPASPPSASA